MKLTLYADGGARGNPGPAAAGAVLKNESGKTIDESSMFFESATNNQAEYAAVILGAKKALELGATDLSIRLDSKLIVEQVKGNWKVKDESLKKAFAKLMSYLQQLESYDIEHIRREKNREADSLVNAELDARGFKKSERKFF